MRVMSVGGWQWVPAVAALKPEVRETWDREGDVGAHVLVTLP